MELASQLIIAMKLKRLKLSIKSTNAHLHRLFQLVYSHQNGVTQYWEPKSTLPKY